MAEPAATANEKFLALLRPIKDVALAFDIDVDEALEEYVEECVRYVRAPRPFATRGRDDVSLPRADATKPRPQVQAEEGAAINWAETGLLLQGSALVFGRKVDGLHGLVYRVLEHLRTGKKEAEKNEKANAEGKAPNPEDEEEEAEDPAAPLARLAVPAAGKAIDLDPAKEKPRAEVAAGDPLIGLLFRPAARAGTGRGAVAAASWIFRGDDSRRRPRAG